MDSKGSARLYSASFGESSHGYSNEKDAKYKTNYAYYEKDEFGDDNSIKRK